MSRTVKAAQYLQIALDIATRIARGELAEGSRIYGRSVMSSEYSVSPETIRRALRTIVRENSDEDNWIMVSQVGNLLDKRYTDFDVRNFGFSKLTPFLESLDMFEIKDMKKDSSSPQKYVRLK